MTTGDRHPAVVIHDLDQALAALSLVREDDRIAVLISPPGGVASLGAQAFAAIADTAKQRFPNISCHFILDCGDEAGLAVDALRHGVDTICIEAPDKVAEKLAAIAEQQNAILDQTPYQRFDGSDAGSLKSWYQALKGSQHMSHPGCELYLITPPLIPDLSSFARDLHAALDVGGVGAVQLRLKDISDDEVCRAAEVLLPICHDHDVMMLMNDRPDLAAKTGCDGVHIGQKDASYKEARKLLGDGAAIGVTCHDSRHLAMVAAEQGADYVAFGAFFPTSTKQTNHHPEPELLAWWQEMMVVPSVAIGGITQTNCGPLVAAGTDFLAVVSSIWNYADGPARAVHDFNEAIARHTPTC